MFEPKKASATIGKEIMLVLWRNSSWSRLFEDGPTIDRTNGYDYENGSFYYSCFGSDGKHAIRVQLLFNLTLNLGCLTRVC